MPSLSSRVTALRLLVWTGGLAPLAWTLWRFAFGDGLGANPIEELILGSGLTAVILLLVTLSVTPLRRLTGLNELQKVRRLLGLFAFGYATMHFLVWFALDQGLALRYIAEDLTERPFIVVGALGFVALVPLAVTSTRGWVRRLGRRWTTLHLLVHPAVALALTHYTWKQKADIRGPLIAWGVFVVLVLVRLAWRGVRKAT